MEIKNIVFDFGGVLVDWNPRYLFRREFDDPEEMEYFLHNICTNEWNLQQDAGRPFAEGVEILQKQYPRYKTMIQKYYEDWEKMLNGEISENIDLLHYLRGHTSCKLFGLTNWSAETIPIARERYSFFDVLEGVIVSGEEKVVKPDPKIYQLLLGRFDLNAEESIFIDDSLQNTKAADELGFHTIHYRENTNLREEFRERGIL